MQRAQVGFEASYRRHLAAEQRRAVLDALAQSFDDESTVGQIVDAAVALGYTGLGDLSLADLADALLTEARTGQDTATAAVAPAADDDEDAGDDDEDEAEASAADDEAADDDEEADEDEDDEEDEEVEAAAPAKGRGRAAKGKAAKSKPAAKGKPAAKPAVAAKAAKPAAKGKAVKISLDDRMSLAEAAAVLLPLVRSLGQATMQQLEQSTAGAGRRKLRFHIGQLVRNGHLERHGMGRGTYYTVV